MARKPSTTNPPALVEAVARAIWRTRYPSWEWEADLSWKDAQRRFYGKRTKSRRRALEDARAALSVAFPEDPPQAWLEASARQAYGFVPDDLNHLRDAYRGLRRAALTDGEA